MYAVPQSREPTMNILPTDMSEYYEKHPEKSYFEIPEPSVFLESYLESGQNFPSVPNPLGMEALEKAPDNDTCGGEIQGTIPTPREAPETQMLENQNDQIQIMTEIQANIDTGPNLGALPPPIESIQMPEVYNSESHSSGYTQRETFNHQVQALVSPEAKES